MSEGTSLVTSHVKTKERTYEELFRGRHILREIVEWMQTPFGCRPPPFRPPFRCRPPLQRQTPSSETDPLPVDRQMLLKTLPSLAVGKYR